MKKCVKCTSGRLDSYETIKRDDWTGENYTLKVFYCLHCGASSEK